MATALVIIAFIAGIWLYGKYKMLREGGHN